MHNASITIDLLRHGELESHHKAYIGQTDIATSTNGYQAMLTLVEGNDYTGVVSSPLQRCSVFAKDFSSDRQIPLQIEENLSEISFGEFEGKTANDLLNSNHKKALQNWWADMENNAPPDGESLAVFRKRVLNTFNKTIKAQTNNDSLLFITHGGVIRCLICYLLEIPFSRLFDFELNRASLTRLTLNPTNPQQSRLIFLNKTNNNNQ